MTDAVTILDELVKISCSEEVTIENVHNLKVQIEKYLYGEDMKDIVVDLSNTKFLDSSGIGFLVSTNSKLKKSDKNLYLLKPSEQICKTLELVRLLSIFNIIESETDI